jgi:hypothetical protein
VRRALVLAIALAVLAAPATALAHEGNPNYRSVIDGVKPAVKGVSITVLGYDDQMQLLNRSTQTVTIQGYNGEPYARVLPDGTVEVNKRSPAMYLNEDRLGDITPPKSADPKLPPQWVTQGKDRRFIWHDHRMHEFSNAVPPQVKDVHKRTKIWDYSVPISVGSTKGAITGTLYWAGKPKGFPIAAIISLIAVIVLAIVFVVIVRRRRGTPPEDGDGEADVPDSRVPDEPTTVGAVKEAW